MKYCKECGTHLDDYQFYYSNNINKYPDGRLNICKDCTTKKVKAFNPETFLWILKEVDVPYIPSAWEAIRDNLINRKLEYDKKATLGRYLSKMKLYSFRLMRWKDTKYNIECELSHIQDYFTKLIKLIEEV